VAVTERDDRDPTSEVEVLAAVGVPDAAAIATNEGEIGAGICRQKALDSL
jgi:hypothetical protein